MAQTHNEIRKGWLSEAVNRALGRTREGGIERISETLDPVLNLWGMPEWAYLRGELLWSGQVTQVAVAGEQSMLALTNPANSNLIVVIESILLAGSVQNVRITPTVLRTDIEATLALALVPQARDNRWWQSPIVVGKQARTQFWTGSNAGSLGGIGTEKIGIVAGTFTLAATPPYILRPGTSLLIEGVTVNLGVDFTVSGRERTAYPGELV